MHSTYEKLFSFSDGRSKLPIAECHTYRVSHYKAFLTFTAQWQKFFCAHRKSYLKRRSMICDTENCLKKSSGLIFHIYSHLYARFLVIYQFCLCWELLCCLFLVAVTHSQQRHHDAFRWVRQMIRGFSGLLTEDKLYYKVKQYKIGKVDTGMIFTVLSVLLPHCFKYNSAGFCCSSPPYLVNNM